MDNSLSRIFRRLINELNNSNIRNRNDPINNNNISNLI